MYKKTWFQASTGSLRMYASYKEEGETIVCGMLLLSGGNMLSYFVLRDKIVCYSSVWPGNPIVAKFLLGLLSVEIRGLAYYVWQNA